jgi:hypothetical protein
MWLAGYVLARCGRGDSPPDWLGARSWKGAYQLFYDVLAQGRSPRTFANSLKNCRDTFDPFVGSQARTGWRDARHEPPAQLPSQAASILRLWKDRSEPELQAAVQPLLNGAVPGSEGRDPGSAPRGRVTLLTDEKAIASTFGIWLQKVTKGAVRRSPNIWWLPGVSLSVRGSALRGSSLSREERRAARSCELNPCGGGGGEDRLSGIGRDQAGRLWLMRQGRLKPHGREHREVTEKEFRLATGLAPVPVLPAKGTSGRDWYPVCRIDAQPAEVIAATTLFVARCDLARAYKSGDVFGPQLAREKAVLAGDEIMGFLKRKARPSAAETRILKKHAEVWNALRDALKRRKLRFEKPRPAPGYEVDGVIRLKEPVLVEIKTAVTAADVYEAVGQLTLYRHLLWPHAAHRQLLVVPDAPSAPLAAALKDLNFHVCRYRRATAKGRGSGRIVFEDILFSLCRSGSG